MESGDSGVTSPVLRVTAEITEIKEKHERNSNHHYSSLSPSLANKECKTHSTCTKKKILKPLYGCNPYERSNYGGSYVSSQHNPKNNVSSFTQRVMSAKLLRMKQLQNQLHETQTKLNEVLQENRTLKTLQQRQDYVLKKYEGNQEQLPQLMRSHHEEIRVLNEKYKQLRSNYRELENRLKQKDNELTILREQHKHLLKLAKDKQLGEREKLSKKIEEMQVTIDEQRKTIFMLNKKLDLEEKTYSHQLSQENAKQKKLQAELNSALDNINALKSTLEMKERMSAVSFRRPVQNSAKTPNIPLRVSIRQPQQHAHSNNAPEHEESETTDDSFTMNYSPVIQRSSSLDSESSATSKEHSIQGAKTLPNSIRPPVSIRNHSLSNGPKTSRALMSMASHESSKSILNSVIMKKDEHIPKPEESKVRRKLQAQRILQKQGTTISASTKGSSNKIDKDLSQLNGKESEKLDLVDAEHKEPEAENLTTPNSIAIPEKPVENTDLASNPEKVVNTDMKLDLDLELEKYFQNTHLTDEAINEFYQKDFREEIYELERKFQELNAQNNEKIERMKAANTFNDIESSSESDSDGTASTTKQWGEPNKMPNGTLNISDNFTVPVTRPAIPMLGESQKANLLKVLNTIDEVGNKNDTSSEIIELPQISTSPKLTSSEFSYLDKVNELKNSYSRTRRKSEVIKDLFGGDTAVLKS